MNDRFIEHAKKCENLLGGVSHLNRLNDDELLQFRSALDENKALMTLDAPSHQFANELNFYNEVLSQVLDNQEKYPRPPGP
ncbi:MAG: hypothetical protein P4M14_11745 [Gammaproteobacteria bacterium]|nr:hypothetical protein [Gammaproteobacteria bacterium]